MQLGASDLLAVCVRVNTNLEIVSLSEDPDCVVGVIEAGEFHHQDPAADVPGKWFLIKGLVSACSQ